MTVGFSPYGFFPSTLVRSALTLWSLLLSPAVVFGDEAEDVRKALAQEEASMVSPKAATASEPNTKPDTKAGEGTKAVSLPNEGEGTAPVSATTEVVEKADGLLEVFTYSSQGKRDPFAPPSFQVKTTAQRIVNLNPGTELERYELDELRLSAILWNVSKPRALVQDPKGNSYIVIPNQKIGRNNGYVAAIREGEMVVVEPLQEDGRIVFSTKLMRMIR